MIIIMRYVNLNLYISKLYIYLATLIEKWTHFIIIIIAALRGYRVDHKLGY